jgi:hypothetical protein
VVDVADLAALVTRRAFERLEADEARVAIGDAVAVLRLAHEIEHDDALAERDTARRQMEEWKVGLWTIHNAIVKHYGREGWAAISAEVRKLSPAMSELPRTCPSCQLPEAALSGSPCRWRRCLGRAAR